MKTERLAQPEELPAGLSKPAQRALTSAGYLHLEDLTKVSEAEVKKLHGMGPKGVDLLRQTLRACGLSFAQPRTR